MITLTRTRPAQMASLLAICGLALLMAAVSLMLLNNSLTFGIASYLSIFNAFLPVGWLIATRRSENTIGWLFLAISISTNLSWVMEEYARVSLVTAPGSLLGAVWVAWLVSLVQPLAWILMFTSLLLFPTGRPLNRGWGIFIWGNFIFFGISIFFGALTAPYLIYFPDIHSPVYVGDLLGLPTMMEGIAGFGNVAAVVIVAVLRFRRANSVEKQQLKWFTYSLLTLPALSVVQQVAQNVFGISHVATDYLSIVSNLPPIIAVGIAILRYRLYDIDLIIRRTLVYAVLTSMLAILYWGGVVLLQSLLRPITGEGNDLAVVATTLIVAGLFLPLRGVVQRFIDRRFYRKKYDAARTLAQFGQVARDEVHLHTLAGELVGVVSETMQPEHISLWLRPGTSAHRALEAKE